MVEKLEIWMHCNLFARRNFWNTIEFGVSKTIYIRRINNEMVKTTIEIKSFRHYWPYRNEYYFDINYNNNTAVATIAMVHKNFSNENLSLNIFFMSSSRKGNECIFYATKHRWISPFHISCIIYNLIVGYIIENATICTYISVSFFIVCYTYQSIYTSK